jgi:succinoglycan biosynthesis protein ExoA
MRPNRATFVVSSHIPERFHLVISDPHAGKELPMPESQSIHVSVVVPCRNEIRHIRAFLDSVLRQKLGRIEMEVLIADGMSEDGTRLVLDEFERKFAAVRVLDNPEKIASTALNRGIREARGEIIIRMDAHATYAADYVRSCVEVLHETNAENVGGPALTRADGYIAQAIALGFHTPFATGGAKFRDPRYAGPADTVVYGCWRKSTLERIGLFDEKMVRGQDYELNARLLSSGGTVWQSPKITFWYRPRASLSGLFRQYFQYGFWKVAVVRKHGRLASWRNFVPGSCLLGGAILLLCAAAANFGGVTWWRDMFLADWFTLAGLYFIASFATAFAVAKRKGWGYLPSLPIVFAVYHFSYALGFVLALLFRPTTLDGPNPIRKVLTAITR